MYVADENDPDHVQNPLVDRHADWFYYQPFILSNVDGAAEDFSGYYSLQGKSSRKMDEIGERLWCSWATAAVPGESISYQFRMVVSVLLLLP